MQGGKIVTDAVREGVVLANFAWPRYPDSKANALVHLAPDPIANHYRFKLGNGVVRKIGESKFKISFEHATFKSRIIG